MFSMFVLRPYTKKHRVVCPACVERGEVLDICPICHGSATKGKTLNQYYVKDKPIVIERIDRDSETGILRYWEDKSNFYYETVYPEVHKYTPVVPHGVHLCHYTESSAKAECKRINDFLAGEALYKEASKIDVSTIVKAFSF